MSQTNRLYQNILDITTDYLGPAAQRFVDRQIEYHLKKTPKNLNAKDLEVFIDWTGAALAMLTDDKSLRREYTQRLKSLLPKRNRRNA